MVSARAGREFRFPANLDRTQPNTVRAPRCGNLAVLVVEKNSGRKQFLDFEFAFREAVAGKATVLLSLGLPYVPFISDSGVRRISVFAVRKDIRQRSRNGPSCDPLRIPPGQENSLVVGMVPAFFYGKVTMWERWTDVVGRLRASFRGGT